MDWAYMLEEGARSRAAKRKNSRKTNWEMQDGLRGLYPEPWYMADEVYENPDRPYVAIFPLDIFPQPLLMDYRPVEWLRNNVKVSIGKNLYCCLFIYVAILLFETFCITFGKTF